MWTGGSVAKSLYPTPNVYDYRIESRMAPSPLYRGRSTSTTPRPLIQQYWQQFVRNLPTLPPLRWNMTNSLGNLFAAGAQQIIETPIAANQRTERPRRRRVHPTRKTKTKKNKTRQGLQSSSTGSSGSNYNPLHLQLQPLGVDKNGVMHLYEPSARKFYALQMEPQLSHYDLYSPYNEDASDQEQQSNDDAYYPHSDYEYKDSAYEGEDSGYEEQRYQTHDEENNANNDYNNYGSDDNDDNVEVVDNWGYNDEDVFADRKLKRDETNTNLEELTGSIIRIQKNFLKPETEEVALHQLNNAKKPVAEGSKQKVRKEAVEKNNEESGRDAAMNNAAVHKKRKQTVKQNKTSKILLKVTQTRGNIVYTPVIFTVADNVNSQKQ